jgi:hypothetical protein
MNLGKKKNNLRKLNICITAVLFDGNHIWCLVMRRIIATIFLSLLMLQAIPVLHFFSTRGEVFYTSIDEEKSGEDLKEKKAGKEFLSVEMDVTIYFPVNTSYYPVINNSYASPSLALLTPPPDALI